MIIFITVLWYCSVWITIDKFLWILCGLTILCFCCLWISIDKFMWTLCGLTILCYFSVWISIDTFVWALSCCYECELLYSLSLLLFHYIYSFDDLLKLFWSIVLYCFSLPIYFCLKIVYIFKFVCFTFQLNMKLAIIFSCICSLKSKMINDT